MKMLPLEVAVARHFITDTRMVSDRCTECITSEQAAVALPAVIRHPDITLFKTSQKIAAEVFSTKFLLV